MIALIELGVLGTHITIWRASAARHQMILRRIDGDAVQPGVESAVTAKIGECAVGFDKSLLGNILSFMRVMHEPHDQPKDLVLVFHYQQIKRPLVTTLHSLNQLLVLLLSQHERSSSVAE